MDFYNNSNNNHNGEGGYGNPNLNHNNSSQSHNINNNSSSNSSSSSHLPPRSHSPFGPPRRTSFGGNQHGVPQNVGSYASLNQQVYPQHNSSSQEQQQQGQYHSQYHHQPRPSQDKRISYRTNRMSHQQKQHYKNPSGVTINEPYSHDVIDEYHYDDNDPRSVDSSARNSFIDNPQQYNSGGNHSYPLSRPALARHSSNLHIDPNAHNDSYYGPYSQSPPDSRVNIGTASPGPWDPRTAAPSPGPWDPRSTMGTPSPVPWTEKGSSLSLGPYSVNTPFRSSEMLSSLIPEHQITGTGANILKLASHDDKGRLSRWRTICWFISPIAAFVTLSAYWVYFVLRIMYVISAQNANGEVLPMAWLFVGVEVSVAIPIFLQLFWTLFVWKKRDRPRLRLQGDVCPTIDVLITCCKEDVDLIVDTSRAACELDYPSDRFRVVVLDDGADEDLRRALSVLQDQYPNLHYRAREKIKGVPHHFKAGNLNYGIRETQLMPGGGGELIAALDADMIPEEHWLRAVVPHLLVDPKLAMACPPQLFYNLPRGDPLCQSLDFFVHVSEPVKDALGVAWCTGSGYVVRRNALVEIGCFPQGSLAEDVCTSTLLLGAGWKTAYVHEPLQFGTVPESFGAHLKQRTRWAIGTVDTSFRLKFCIYGANIAKMKFWPRLSGFVYSVTSLFNIFLLISLFALPIVFASGRPLIAYGSTQELRNLIYSCFICVLANRVCDIVMFAAAGYTNGQRGARAQLWMSPYFALTMVRSFILPQWLGGQAQSFKPTGSIKSELNERDPPLRAPLFRRLKVICFNYLSIFHIMYVYFVLSAVTVATSRCVISPPSYLFQSLSTIDPKNRLTQDVAPVSFTRAQFQCLLTHAYWPPVAWVLLIASFWMPVSYAINPPDMPPREDLLIRDPKTGVARAREEYKKAGWTGGEVIYEILYSGVTLFTVFVFGLAFWWI